MVAASRAVVLAAKRSVRTTVIGDPYRTGHRMKLS